MRPSLLTCFLLWAVAAPGSWAQSGDPERGKLLYSTHCIECHSVQMHWRAQRQASDWSSLRAQVRRWQKEVRLQWTEQDIDAVAQHLNDTIYAFPKPQQIGMAAVP